ncbi:MAG: protein-(glutamine-N5) methyltransferase, release factor-specific [Coxiellaceae bacterium]|nr:protein-(glutamine-N5) methyltransferase, release factor-specific [Coxiellaceae bacterium]|tara:strand:- start:397 stop:1263 length:867 start_codon:yes stop_codon:yes gene_type:complete
MTRSEESVMTLKEIRQSAVSTLDGLTSSALLDVDLILMKACQLSRSACYAFSEKVLTQLECDTVATFVERRKQGEPLAYILGEKEFWSLMFNVSAATLIPRPETECLVEWVLTHTPNELELKVADLGTGSGAIAVALAKERPSWKIDATDYSVEALRVAESNVQRHRCGNVRCFHGDWYDALPSSQYHLIVSNPPYINSTDPHLLNLRYEPRSALVSNQEGFSDLYHIIEQARSYLFPGGRCIVEHGVGQGQSLMQLMEKQGYIEIMGYSDFSGNDRFVVGKTPLSHS